MLGPLWFRFYKRRGIWKMEDRSRTESFGKYVRLFQWSSQRLNQNQSENRLQDWLSGWIRHIFLVFLFLSKNLSSKASHIMTLPPPCTTVVMVYVQHDVNQSTYCCVVYHKKMFKNLSWRVLSGVLLCLCEARLYHSVSVWGKEKGGSWLSWVELEVVVVWWGGVESILAEVIRPLCWTSSSVSFHWKHSSPVEGNWACPVPFLDRATRGWVPQDQGGGSGSGPWEKHNPWPLYSTCSSPLHPHTRPVCATCHWPLQASSLSPLSLSLLYRCVSASIQPLYLYPSYRLTGQRPHPNPPTNLDQSKTKNNTHDPCLYKSIKGYRGGRIWLAVRVFAQNVRLVSRLWNEGEDYCAYIHPGWQWSNWCKASAPIRHQLHCKLSLKHAAETLMK